MNDTPNLYRNLKVIELDNYRLKQMIIMRKDLNMRKGKMIAQGAHASLGVVLENMEHPNVIEWLNGRFAKIAVSVDSLNELEDIINKCEISEIPYKVIEDAGFTEFNNVPTVTCMALIPETKERLRDITGQLKLL